MNPLPGEVWLADLGLTAKTRPVVIISSYDPDPPRALITYIPITTQNRHSPYEIVLPKLSFLVSNSIVNVQGLGSIPRVRLDKKLGLLSDDVMAEIKNVILFALDLGVE